MTEDLEPAIGRLTVGSLLKAFTFAFSVWALVVGWGVHRVTEQMDNIAIDQRSFVHGFNAYVLQMEHRATAIEDGQRIQDSKSEAIDARVKDIERRLENARLR